jgi:hypothetical protein
MRLITRHQSLTGLPTWAVSLLSAVLLLGLVGCSSTSGGGPTFGGGSSVQELHLFVMPVPIASVAGGPPDGIAVRAFATPKGRATGGLIRNGKLEVLAFDGTVALTDPRTQAPTRSWAFTAKDLAPLAATGSLGTGYELALRWMGPRPAGERLTIVLRYTPPSGPSLISAPSVVQNVLR